MPASRKGKKRVKSAKKKSRKGSTKGRKKKRGGDAPSPGAFNNNNNTNSNVSNANVNANANANANANVNVNANANANANISARVRANAIQEQILEGVSETPSRAEVQRRRMEEAPEIQEMRNIKREKKESNKKTTKKKKKRRKEKTTGRREQNIETKGPENVPEGKRTGKFTEENNRIRDFFDEILTGVEEGTMTKSDLEDARKEYKDLSKARLKEIKKSGNMKFYAKLDKIHKKNFKYLGELAKQMKSNKINFAELRRLREEHLREQGFDPTELAKENNNIEILREQVAQMGELNPKLAKQIRNKVRDIATKKASSTGMVSLANIRNEENKLYNTLNRNFGISRNDIEGQFKQVEVGTSEAVQKIRA